MTDLTDEFCSRFHILFFNVFRIRFQKEQIFLLAVLDFPLQSLEKKVYFPKNYANFLYNSLTNVVNFCTSGTLAKKVARKIVFIF